MRGKRASLKSVDPDPRYGSALLAKFINHVMHDGEKTVARRVVYRAFDIIHDKTDKEALGIFEKAITNVEPRLEVFSRRVGGANYQVPRQVRGERRQFLAMNWILEVARNQKGRPMAQRLADALMDAANNEGAAIQKKANMHRMAEANKAFAHLAW